jgi:hypothetical protein
MLGILLQTAASGEDTWFKWLVVAAWLIAICVAIRLIAFFIKGS